MLEHISYVTASSQSMTALLSRAHEEQDALVQGIEDKEIQLAELQGKLIKRDTELNTLNGQLGTKDVELTRVMRKFRISEEKQQEVINHAIAFKLVDPPPHLFSKLIGLSIFNRTLNGLVNSFAIYKWPRKSAQSGNNKHSSWIPWLGHYALICSRAKMK
jgi:uncharacterized coiled-coil protein SlyX